MNNEITFRFPVLTITAVSPLLQKDGQVFAFSIKALTENGDQLSIYENKGLDLANYVGKKMEFLLEITKGEFDHGDDTAPPAKGTRFKYQWEQRMSSYFTKLVGIADVLDSVDESEEAAIEADYEKTANRLFRDWGVSGLNIGIYEAKPLVSTAFGDLLLNEYQFEEEVEELELNEEKYIRIEELYLRGIRPVDGNIVAQPLQEPAIPDVPIHPEVPLGKKKPRTYFT